jgi:hypothetical protein
MIVSALDIHLQAAAPLLVIDHPFFAIDHERASAIFEPLARMAEDMKPHMSAFEALEPFARATEGFAADVQAAGAFEPFMRAAEQMGLIPLDRQFDRSKDG